MTTSHLKPEEPNLPNRICPGRVTYEFTGTIPQSDPVSQEPDRVPIDVGQDFHNGIHEVAYANILKHLGETDEIRRYDPVQHLAVVKQSVLDRLHADTRYVFASTRQSP